MKHHLLVYERIRPADSTLCAWKPISPFNTMSSPSRCHQPDKSVEGTMSQKGDTNLVPSKCSANDGRNQSGGWFGDIKSLAKSTKDTIFPAIDGVASFIHRSAMTVAAEIAQLERDAELEAERWRQENYGASTGNSERVQKQLPLPWEVKPRDSDMSSDLLEDENFKLRIMELSTTEDTFLEPYGSGEAEDFPLTEDRIRLIRRLLALDENLAAIHAKLSGRSDVKEALFWKNYFYNCDRLRMEYEDLADIDVASRSTLGSLVPVGEERTFQPDESSYVCVRNGIASPPSSLNTLASTLSVGDMVVIGADGCDFSDLDAGKLS